MNTDDAVSRREFLSSASQAGIGSLAAASNLTMAVYGAEPEKAQSRQAMSTRTGEPTDASAIVWTRLTKNATRNNEGIEIKPRRDAQGKRIPATVNVPIEDLEGACPGAAGRVRLRYGLKPDFSDARTTPWVDVTAANDFIHQFRLVGLSPGSRYYYESQTAGPDDSAQHAPLRGRFRTAPAADAPSELRFCVMTCQGYQDRGHPEGHAIYPSMLQLDPAFTCLTGDLVYYDSNEPSAVSPELARYHWQRMFSLPRLAEFTRQVSTYWLKDDHDSLKNDGWPGTRNGTLEWEEGLRIFRQQAPLAEGPSYRTFRWGRDLQIWFTDGRDYRSPNRMPDGPEKTIWGAEQKAWFKQTVLASDATWKLLVSPTPLVGPDRPNKNDNHANKGFQTEGDEIRGWLKEHVPDNFFVICGDRHWQYHSVHPQTGLHEFSAGPASDEHASGTPGEDKAVHRFHRVKGGFLSVTVEPAAAGSILLLRHHDVHGAVVHEHRRDAKPTA